MNNLVSAFWNIPLLHVLTLVLKCRATQRHSGERYKEQVEKSVGQIVEILIFRDNFILVVGLVLFFLRFLSFCQGSMWKKVYIVK